MTRDRRAFDDVWQLLVEACGGCCVDCKKPDVQLYRGHITPARDGGQMSVANIQPLCRPCNLRESASQPNHDLRPDGWRERFIKLVAENMVPTPPENAGLVPIQGSVEQAKNAAFTRWHSIPINALRTGTATIRTAHDAAGLVQNLVWLSTRLSYPPRSPWKNRYDEMLQLARTEPLFIEAGRRFLKEESWDDQTRDAWQPFCDSFFLYKRMHEEAVAQATREATAQAAREKEAEEKARPERRAAFENWLRDMSSLPDIEDACPILTDEDRQHIAAIRAKYSFTSPHTVQVELGDLKRSVGLSDRHSVYMQKRDREERERERKARINANILKAARQLLFDRLERSGVDEDNQNHLDLFYAIRNAQTESELCKIDAEFNGRLYRPLEDTSDWSLEDFLPLTQGMSSEEYANGQEETDTGADSLQAQEGRDAGDA